MQFTEGVSVGLLSQGVTEMSRIAVPSMLREGAGSLPTWDLSLLAPVWHWLLGQSLGIVALVVSIVALRRERPRLEVSTSVATVVDLGGRSMVFVRVTNKGAAEAPISGIGVTGRDTWRRQDGGPPLPHILAAHGGTASWLIDYGALRQQLGAHPWESDRVKGWAQVGDKTVKSRQSVRVIPFGGNAGRKMSWRRDFRWKWDRLVKPQPAPFPGLDPVEIDAAKHTYRMRVSNLGGGIALGVVVYLTDTDEHGVANYVREVGQIPVGCLLRGRSRSVSLPIVPDAPPDHHLTWWAATRGHRGGQGVGALTESRAAAILAARAPDQAPSTGPAEN